MTGTEKIKAMLENKTVDAVGACGWVHTPEADRKPVDEFVHRVIELTDEHRWDFIKLMSNGWYIQEAYGEKLHFYEENIPLAFQKIKRLADMEEPLVTCEEDLETLPLLDAANNAVVRYNAEVVKRLAEHYHGEKPVIATIFTPSTILPDLCGSNEAFLHYIETCPEKVHTALDTLLEGIEKIADTLIEAGADGLFISTKNTSPEMIPVAWFDEFSRSYDEKLLSHIKGKAWFNILHVHGQHNLYMDAYADYDVQAINWENVPHGMSGKGVTTVADLRAKTDKILIGGTDQFYDFYGTVEEVTDRFRMRLQTAVREAGDNRFIFAPGCSLPLDVPQENLHLIRTVVDEYLREHPVYAEKMTY